MTYKDFLNNCHSQKPSKGLYVISVPIGNLQDITLRALDILSHLDKIYCEDTRVTRKLLSYYQITPPELIRCDMYVEENMLERMIQDITQEKAIGLVSDAGTPLISDPGYILVKGLRAHNMPIYPIPGVNAAISAISISGLPTDQFRFLGFVPKKNSERLSLINHILQNQNSYIFYERPERIGKFLMMFPEMASNIQIFIAREMTKLHETYLWGDLADVTQKITNMPLKGEAVIIISSHNYRANQGSCDMDTEILQRLKAGLSPKDIAQDDFLRQFASRNELYAKAQDLKI